MVAEFEDEEALFNPTGDELYSDWNEDEVLGLCPFCPAQVSPTQFLKHSLDHSIDFKVLLTANQGSEYDCFKLLNYVRKNPKATQFELMNLMAMSEWKSNDALLVPVLENDVLLSDLAELLIDDSSDVEHDDDEPLKEKNWQARALAAEEQLKLFQSALTGYKEMMTSSIHDRPSIEKQPVSDYYFNSYAQTAIHETMLKDSHRTEAYRDFIYSNKDAFKDRIVLDVGCGTGILSMFAAKAGAKHVYSVDNSDIIHSARAIIVENELDNITLIRGKVEEISLPVQKVDIILSEWMGYFMLFEGMLDSVISARDKWLAPGGTMSPSSCSMFVMGLADEDYYNDRYNFWNNVYGFKMSCMKPCILTEGHVETINGSHFPTSVDIIAEFNLNTVSVAELDFESDFVLELQQDCTLYGIIGWFDTQFDCSGLSDHPISVVLTTSPSSTPTHWRQTVFLFEHPIDGLKGQCLTGKIICNKDPECARDLQVDIQTFVSLDSNGRRNVIGNEMVLQTQRFHVR